MPAQPGGADGDAQGRASIRRRCLARSPRRGAVGAALRLPPQAIASALGIAGSMASGIIEYLAEGTWTKRMHAGLGGAVGHPRRADGARRFLRAADGARRHARLLSRVRAVGAARLSRRCSTASAADG